MKKRREPFVIVLLTAGSLLGPMGCIYGGETSVNPPEPEADAGLHDSSNPPPPDATPADATEVPSVSDAQPDQA